MVIEKVLTEITSDLFDVPYGFVLWRKRGKEPIGGSGGCCEMKAKSTRRATKRSSTTPDNGYVCMYGARM